MKVLIAGAGIGGLTAALALYDVAVLGHSEHPLLESPPSVTLAR